MNKTIDKSIIHDIFIIQCDDSIMRGFYCFGFIEYMIASKTNYTNLSTPNDYKKNGKII